ncbi:MAG: hypothetical protein A4E60_02611 [Syntrophorhabdus sp. PtaB.Bin047]|jgi:hypothetical protein|nr:MAG: hypothetical protein A4E60_02611 [Syntrophorhabdus sp. PtaB.Bin047]
MLPLICEINTLWETVYPHLARHIGEVYGRTSGAVLEVGPFCGVVYDLVRQGIGSSFRIASFPRDMDTFYTGEIEKRSMGDTVDIIGTSPDLSGIEDSTIDLLVFRGALFFPSLFKVDHRAILRVLRPGGTAFVGGGFGKYTPPEIIRPLADRSRELNYLIGKKETTVDDIRKDLEAAGITENARIITEGGLWILLKK